MTDETTLSSAVDLAHLNQYTGGDTGVNREVMQLFGAQAGEMLARLEQSLTAADQPGWFNAAHTFKGASRGIGAFALADAIAGAEQLDLATQGVLARTSLETLKARNEQVLAFIKAYLG